ncbi:MAG: radical SAM protein [Chloroflexota bacterium]
MADEHLDPEDIRDFTQAKFERNIPRFAMGPTDATWEVTNACNLRCKHCFLPDASAPLTDELSTEEGYALIDNLVEAGVRSLLFSGGEPLLRSDLEQLARYASKRLTIWLQTNGWFLEEKAEALKGLGFEQIQVSLDGATAETHDYFRGKGSFERALRGVRKCVELGFPSVGIGCVVSQKNLAEVPRMVEMALELRVNAFETLTFMPSGRGERLSRLALTAEQRMNLYRYLAETQQRLRQRMVVGSEEPYMYVENRALLEACAHPHSRAVGIGCGAGLVGCAVKPNGKVFPCVGVTVEIGDLRRERLKDVWHTSGVLAALRNRRDIKGKCGRCEYKFVCSGCRGTAYALTGDVMGEDPTCWYEPKLGA